MQMPKKVKKIWILSLMLILMWAIPGCNNNNWQDIIAELVGKQELEIPRNQGSYFFLLGTLVLNLIYTILSILFLEKSRNCLTVRYEYKWILTDFHITMEKELSSSKAF